MRKMITLLHMYRHFRRLGAGQFGAAVKAVRVYQTGF
ncbi:hypothetical protein JAB1_46650 [Janthinobacterium sp. MP5059B]|nr:hypothetical protein JAB1_46650 [Janthinobacterium sp. MP5059B]